MTQQLADVPERVRGEGPTASTESDLVSITPRKPRRSWSPPRAVRRAVGPVLVVVAWHLFSVTGLLHPDVLAAPLDVLSRGTSLWSDGQLPDAILASAKRVVVGFVIGGAVALVLSLLAGLFRLGEDLLDSTLGMIRMVPWVGLIPLFIIWFGIDETPKIALVALGVCFPLYFNIYGAIRTVDSQLIEAGETLGLGRLGLIRHVILPAALPGALVGLRYALGTAWLALVFAEQVNASAGIGYLMNTGRDFFQTDVIVVCLVVYAVLGLISDQVVRLLSKVLLSWQASFDGK
ncbi:ABC transporter permease [Rhodococcus jostii]|uniref:Sulfonate transport system permease protein n=1 Tax=Rhodococcus jostii TaxID=132919 RepID=A0A1H5HFA3_RHOJO|nr:ABC transporter permease [Rhodococcus jostii]SEE26424.1 sulfonate transport system permease protein [Rhodococcus jostii]